MYRFQNNFLLLILLLENNEVFYLKSFLRISKNFLSSTSKDSRRISTNSWWQYKCIQKLKKITCFLDNESYHVWKKNRLLVFPYLFLIYCYAFSHSHTLYFSHYFSHTFDKLLKLLHYSFFFLFFYRPPSARPPSARPSSSRPAPPRIRIRHVVDNEENK